jgi:hypothetical protein
MTWTDFRRGWEPVSKGLPSEGGDSMSEDTGSLPDKSNKKEEQGLLAKVKDLAPLFELIIRILELLLKIFRVIS